MQVSDFGRKFVVGVLMLVMAAAIVSTQIFGVGDRPAEEFAAPPQPTAQPQPAQTSAGNVGAEPSSGVEVAKLSPIPVGELQELAEDAVKFAAVLEDPKLAPPDRMARMDGRASSLAVDPDLPPSVGSPPKVTFTGTEILSPQYVTFVVVNSEHADTPRYISFADDGSGRWNVVDYSDSLPVDKH